MFRSLGPSLGMANILNNLGVTWFVQGELAQARTLLEGAKVLCHVMDDVQGRIGVENNLAFVELENGHGVSAAARFQANLGVAAELGDRWTIAECLEGIAAAVGFLHAPLRAARLWGGAAALREALQAPAESDMVVLYTRYQTAARMALNQAAWFAAWTEGECLASDALLSTDD